MYYGRKCRRLLPPLWVVGYTARHNFAGAFGETSGGGKLGAHTSTLDGPSFGIANGHRTRNVGGDDEPAALRHHLAIERDQLSARPDSRDLARALERLH